MGGRHHGQLYIDRSSTLHALAPQVKIVAAVAATFAVVATSRRAVWAFGVHALVLVAVAASARLPLATLRRLAIEIPFVAGAALLPLISRGPRVQVLGTTLSETGLWAAWNIVAKATLGAAIGVLLVSTTRASDLLGGLHRLRTPRLVVAIAGFTVRYSELLVEDLRKVRIARLARGDDPRWLWQARSVAAGAATTFVRAFERGERVHLAMLARGYDPTVDPFAAPAATRGDLARSALVPIGLWLVAASSWAVL